MNDLFKIPLDKLGGYSDRELLEDIHRMLVALTASPAKPKVKGVPKARHDYEPAFEELWKAYPARNGSNPKWKAQQAWRARKKESDYPVTEHDKMINGVVRYAKWSESTNKTGTEMVMQAARFLGPSREYANAWDVPAPELEVIKLPRDNEALVVFAAKRGLAPRIGESWWDFRQRVEDSI